MSDELDRDLRAAARENLERMGVAHRPSNERVASGCDLCGDFPIELHARCHPTAPLRVEMISPAEVVFYCYLPQCNREVARLQLAAAPESRDG